MGTVHIGEMFTMNAHLAAQVWRTNSSITKGSLAALYLDSGMVQNGNLTCAANNPSGSDKISSTGSHLHLHTNPSQIIIKGGK